MSGPLAVLVTLVPGGIAVIGFMYVLFWFEDRKDRLKSRRASTDRQP